MTFPMIKPLFIPPNKKIIGGTVWCKTCGTNVNLICKKNRKPIKQCPHPEDHAIKIYAHVPGTKNARQTKTLATRNIEEAQLQALEFRQQVREGRVPLSENKKHEEATVSHTAPTLLAHLMAKHIAYLEGEAPSHEFRERSPQHLNDIERSYRVTLTFLKQLGKENLAVSEVSNEVVGQIYDHLLHEKKFGSRNVNKYVGFLQRLMEWGIEQYDLPVKNHFKKIKELPINPKPLSATEEEIEKLWKVITPDNGKKQYPNEEYPRYLYREYCIPAYRLLLHSGRRVNEITRLTFNDIKADEKGRMSLLVPDLKVTRSQGLHTTKYVHVPVTQELRELFTELGYEQYQGTDRYLIAPEIERNRDRVMCDDLSRAFTHYFSLVSDRKLTLKSLRKTYITAAHLHTGGNAHLLTGHSPKSSVIPKHYIDKEVVALASHDFSVFPKQKAREDEIKTVRRKSKQINPSKDISK
jgi:integrase